jgi:hypothetical protein
MKSQQITESSRREVGWKFPLQRGRPLQALTGYHPKLAFSAASILTSGGLQ